MSDLRLVVKAETDSGYGSGAYLRATVHLFRIEDGQLRGLTAGYGYSDPDTELADLEITAQLDQQSAEQGQHFYGYGLEFNPYRVDARRARELVKVFTRVEGKMARLDARFGRSQDFGAWLARLADALGVKSFGVISHQGRNFSPNEYRWMDADGIRYWLGQRESEFAAKFAPAGEVAS